MDKPAAGPADRSATGPLQVQRLYGMIGSRYSQKSNAELGEMAAENDDRLALSFISSWSSVSRTHRMGIVDNYLEDLWVDPAEESTLESIWNSFGRYGIEDLLENARDRQRWDDCLDRGAELHDISSLRGLRVLFEQDVRRMANAYLDENRLFVEEEQTRLGLRAAGEGQRAPTEAEQMERTQEIQQIVEQIEQIRALQQALLTIPIAARMPPGGLEGVEPIMFSPEYDPGGTQGWYDHTWPQVKEEWDRLGQALMTIANMSPAAFGALSRERLDDLSADNEPVAARNAMGEVLGDVHAKVLETVSRLASDDLDWRELAPIHAQLFAGDTSMGALDWSPHIMQGVGRDMVQDYQDHQFWLSLGLSTLAAAAFIFSNLATAGLATVAWAGAGIAISGGVAAMSWENYDDLATAAEATAHSERAVVSQEQVDAALVQAWIDTVFAFVDVAGVFNPMGRLAASFARAGTRVAGREAAELGLRSLAELGEAEARELVERSVREVGVEQTLRTTGKTPDELRAIIGQSDELDAALGRAAGLTGLADPAMVRSQLDELEALVSTGQLSRLEADELLSQGIDLFGPLETLRRAGGWEAVGRVIGNEAEAGRRLYAWRDSVFEDLVRFIDPEDAGLIQRTGRQGQLTNDLDFSLLGPDAVTNADRARTFLASRTGMRPAELERLLDMMPLTDPTRMHLYDFIPDEALRGQIARRAAAREEELMWARRLMEARGDDVMEQAVREHMAEQGIREVPYPQLTGGQRQQHAELVDQLHGEFRAAEQAGDTAEMGRLADRIVEHQALINATTEGAYATGGSVRRWVAEREAMLGFGEGGTRPAALSAQQLTDMLNQLTELDHVARGLMEATDDTVIAGLLKKLGKYGARLSETGRGALGTVDPGWRSLFDGLEQRFASFQAAYEGGALSRLTREELLEVRANAFRALGDLEHHSSHFLQQLRREAGVSGLTEGMEAIQQSTRNHLAMLRATAEARRRVLLLSGRVGATLAAE